MHTLDVCLSQSTMRLPNSCAHVLQQFLRYYQRVPKSNQVTICCLLPSQFWTFGGIFQFVEGRQHLALELRVPVSDARKKSKGMATSIAEIGTWGKHMDKNWSLNYFICWFDTKHWEHWQHWSSTATFMLSAAVSIEHVFFHEPTQTGKSTMLSIGTWLPFR